MKKAKLLILLAVVTGVLCSCGPAASKSDKVESSDTAAVEIEEDDDDGTELEVHGMEDMTDEELADFLNEQASSLPVVADPKA